jgi:hypothetical protein
MSPTELNDQPPDLVDKVSNDQPPDLVDPIHNDYLEAKKTSPDKASQISKTAYQINESPEYVEQHFEQLQNVGDIKSPQYFQDMKENNPITHNVLSKPNTMIQMSDTESMEGAKKLEDHVNKFNLIHTLGNLYTQATDPKLWFEDLPEGAYIGYLQSASAAAHIMGVPEDKNQYAKLAKYYKSETQDSLFESFGEAIPTTSAMLGLAYTGNVEAIPFFFGISSFAQAHQEATERGATPLQAMGTASIQGAMGYGLGRLSLGPLTDAATKMVSTIGVNATRQRILQIGATIGTSAVGMYGLSAIQLYSKAFADKVMGVDPNAFDGLDDKIKKAGPSSMVLGGIFGLAGAGAIARGMEHPLTEKEILLKSFVEKEEAKESKINEANKFAIESVVPTIEIPHAKTKETKEINFLEYEKTINDNEKAFIKEMGLISDEIPAGKRNPNILSDIIKSNVGDTPMANVYVPFEAWNKFHGYEAEEKAKEMGLSESYEEFKLRPTTGHLKIPMQTWMTHIHGTPAEEGLINDTKLSEQGKTTNELKEETKKVETKPQEPGAIKKTIEVFKNIIIPKEKPLTENEKASRDAVKQSSDEIGFTNKSYPGLPDELNKYIGKIKDEAIEKAESELNKQQEKETTPANQNAVEKKREQFTKWATEKIENDPRTIALNHLKDSGIDVEKACSDILKGQGTEEEKIRFSIERQLGWKEINGVDPIDLAHLLQGYDSQKEIKTLVDNAMVSHEAPLKDTPQFKEESEKALHTEDTLHPLAVESAILRRICEGKNSALPAFKKESDNALEKVSWWFGLGEEQQKANAEWKRQLDFETKVKKAQIKYDAEKILNSKLSKEAINPRTFYLAEKKAAVAYEKAMNKGDIQGAWKAKDEQLLNHALAIQAWKNMAENVKCKKVINKYAKRGDDLMNMSYGHTKAIDVITEGIGAKMGSMAVDPTDQKIATGILQEAKKDFRSYEQVSNEIADKTGMILGKDKQWKRESIEDFLSRKRPLCRGMDTIIPPDILKSMKPMKELTFGELRDIKNSILVIAHDGIQEKQGLTGEYKQGMSECGKQLIDRLNDILGMKYEDKNEIQHYPNKQEIFKIIKDVITEKPSHWAGKLTWTLTIAHIADGGDNGPFHDFIYRPLSHGEGNYFTAIENRTRALQAIVDKHYLEGEWEKIKDKKYTFDFYQKGNPIDNSQLRQLLLNMGNESNLRRVFDGEKLTREQADLMVSNLSKKDWDYCQSVWDFLEEKWPDIVRLERDARGVEPEQIEARMIIGPHGVYRGGYFPAEYDQTKASIINPLDKPLNDFLQTNNSRKTPERGYAKGRIYSVDKPLSLSENVLFNHIEEVEHDLAFRKPLIDVQRFINQPEVMKALQDSLSVSGYKNLQKWLTYIAAPKNSEMGSFERNFLTPFYKSFMSTIAYRPLMTPLKWSSDVLSTLHDETVKQGNPISAIKTYCNTQLQFVKEIYENGGVHPVIDRINELSPMMKNRPTGFEVETQSLEDLKRGPVEWNPTKPSAYSIGNAANALDRANRFGFVFERIADAGNVYAKWWDVYHENIGKMDKQKAVDIADETIKQQFGTGSILERTGVQRSIVGRIFAPAYSFASMMFQKIVLDKKMMELSWKNGDKPMAAYIAACGMAYIMAQGTTEYLMREAVRNAPEENKWKKPETNIALRTIETTAKTIPLAGTALSWMGEKFIKGRKSYTKELHLDVVDSIAQEYLQPAVDVGDFFKTGKWTEKDSEDSLKAAQLVTKSPQIFNSWVFNFTDACKHDNLRWQDLVSRRAKISLKKPGEGE